MSSWFETVLSDFHTLPTATLVALNSIRENEKELREISSQLQSEEQEILEYLKCAIKNGEDVREEEVVAKSQALVMRRQAYSQRVEKQCQISRDLYENIDEKIKKLDNSISAIVGDGEDGVVDELLLIKNTNNNHLLMQTQLNQSSKKKRKYADNMTMKAQLKAVVGASLDSMTSSNEPVYCTCRRISYGQMLACDNMDCPIEWFHFGCVGIVEEPKDPWFCPDCSRSRNKQQIENTPDQQLADKHDEGKSEVEDNDEE